MELRPNIDTRAARQFGRMLAIYSVVGLVSGIVAVLFAELVDLAESALHLRLAGAAATAVDVTEPEMLRPTGTRWLLLLLPALGGLLAGWLCARLAPEAAGSGTGPVIDSYHRHDGNIRRRVPLIKSFATALTVGTGGSAGVEGPISQITAGVGSIVSGWFSLSGSERRVLIMAGYAAGVGAVFHAPMASALFAAEVLYHEMDLESEVLVPSIIAATLAYGVFGAVRGWEPVLEAPGVTFRGVVELVPYLVLALALALGTVLFVGMKHAVRDLAHRWTGVPPWARPAIGGLVVGLIGVFLPMTLGSGYTILHIALRPEATILVLLALAVAKAVTSLFTTATGGSGGLFAPVLVIGGAVGAVVGKATATIAPELGVQPAAFAVVGMAGFFAATFRCPISAVMMVSEVVGSYRLIVPALWVCALAWILTRRSVLYEEQVATRYDAPFRLADMMGQVLNRMTVRDAMIGAPPTITVPPDMSLRDLVSRFASSKQAVFPIVDPKTGQMMGVTDGRQLRRTLGREGIDTLLIARDFLGRAVTIGPHDTLDLAIGRMTTTGFDELIVVDDCDGRLIGILSRRDVVSAYHRRMLHHSDVVEDVTADFEAPLSGEDDLALALKRGGVLRDVEGDDPEAVLRAMVTALTLPPSVDKARLLALLLEREELTSTGIGDGIALPHPTSDDVSVHIEDAEPLRPVVAIGLLRRPVPWNAIDAQPVTVVCLLLAPSGDVHLGLLSRIAQGLSNPDVRRLLDARAPSRDLLRALGGATRAELPAVTIGPELS